MTYDTTTTTFLQLFGNTGGTESTIPIQHLPPGSYYDCPPNQACGGYQAFHLYHATFGVWDVVLTVLAVAVMVTWGVLIVRRMRA